MGSKQKGSFVPSGTSSLTSMISRLRVANQEATHLDLDDVHDLYTPNGLRVLPLGGKLLRQRNVLGVSDVQKLQLEHGGLAVGDYFLCRVRF